MAKKRKRTKKSNKKRKKAKRAAPVVSTPPARSVSPLMFAGYFGQKSDDQ